MTSLPSGPAPIDASLHLLVDHLLDGLRAGDVPPALLHVTAGDADGFDLGVKPLDGQHPTDLLVGFQAPPEWHGLGMACGGWAYHASERGQTGRRRTRVHIVTLLSRSGELAHRTCIEGADAIGLPVERLDDQQPVGEQIDLLRRCLGLATEPAPCDTNVYWAIRWLSEILATPAAALRDWAAVAERHPAIPLLRQTDGESLPHLGDPPRIVPVARAFARVFDWARLRDLLGEGRFTVDELEGSDAAWFDDGSFARFLLNRCPPLAMLRAQVEQHVGPELAGIVAAALELLDVPDSAWPDDGDRAA